MRKSQLQKVLPLLLLFSALLIVIYLISPKEAGRRVGGSRFDGLVISEVMAANNSAVPDENGEFSDWLELYNGTGADLDMEGVMITNRTDRITFPFPSYTLKAGERVIVFASDSYQLDPSKPFHGKFKISSAGDHLYLYDPDMYLIDELATPTLTADTSYALTASTRTACGITKPPPTTAPAMKTPRRALWSTARPTPWKAARWSSTRFAPIPRWAFPMRMARSWTGWS